MRPYNLSRKVGVKNVYFSSTRRLRSDSVAVYNGFIAATISKVPYLNECNATNRENAHSYCRLPLRSYDSIHSVVNSAMLTFSTMMHHCNDLTAR